MDMTAFMALPLKMSTIFALGLMAQVFASFAMTGLIWLIQGVHYPLMAYIGRDDFVEYVNKHVQWITWIVGPLMLLEAGGTLICLYTVDHSPIPALYMWMSVGLLLIIWAATAFFSIPCHDVLSRGYDAQKIKALVNTNWIRTVAWTLRSLVLLYVLFILFVSSS
jgi:hypothetical protein